MKVKYLAEYHKDPPPEKGLWGISKSYFTANTNMYFQAPEPEDWGVALAAYTQAMNELEHMQQLERRRVAVNLGNRQYAMPQGMLVNTMQLQAGQWRVIGEVE